MTLPDLESRCRDCHARMQSSDKRVAEFAAAFPNCQCEAVSISEHSPGRVKDGERVARLVLEPKHVPNGEIEVGAFTDIVRNGLSVQRRGPNDATRLMQQGEQLARIASARDAQRAQERNLPTPQGQRFLGVIEFGVERLRAFVEADGSRCFCVLDSGTRENGLHADIMAGVKRRGPSLSALLNRLRNLVLEQTPRIPTD